MKYNNKIITVIISVSLTVASLPAEGFMNSCLAPLGCSELTLFFEAEREFKNAVNAEIQNYYEFADTLVEKGDFIGAAHAVFGISELDVYWYDYQAQLWFAAIYGKASGCLLPYRAHYLKKRHGIQGGIYANELAITHLCNARELIDKSHADWGMIHRKLVDEYCELYRLKTDSKERIELLKKALECLLYLFYDLRYDFETLEKKFFDLNIALAEEHFNLGNEYCMSNDFKKSADAYKQAIETAEKSEEIKRKLPLGLYYMSLGESFLNLRKYFDAASALETALQYTVRNSFAYLNILAKLLKANFERDEFSEVLSTVRRITDFNNQYKKNKIKAGKSVVEKAVTKACYYYALVALESEDQKIIKSARTLLYQTAELFAFNGETLLSERAEKDAGNASKLLAEMIKKRKAVLVADQMPPPKPMMLWPRFTRERVRKVGASL